MNPMTVNNTTLSPALSAIENLKLEQTSYHHTPTCEDKQMTPNEIRKLETAIERAIAEKCTWQPVFADVLNDGEKIGHIVSDGYLHSTWSFYPIKSLRKTTRVDGYAARREQLEAGGSYRRSVRNKELEKVIPKWATPYTLNSIQTYSELQESRH